jgi:hypothetical protein
LELARIITRYLSGLVALSIFSFSLLMSPEIDGGVMAFSFLKACAALAFSWLFFLIIADTLVRSIAISAVEHEARRKDGGLLYHFLRADPGEILNKPKT